jgi:hypothetical protein
MKTIVEEWKKIEEFPGNEISNMGRCRRVRSRIKGDDVVIKKVHKSSNWYNYCFRRNNIDYKLSPGKLVAQYFIPNPEGYKFIQYKDGNFENYCYLNIEWVKFPNQHRPLGIRKKKVYPLDDQLEKLRKHQRKIILQIEAIENNKIGEFVHSEVLPIIENESHDTKISYNDREEFMSYAKSEIYDKLSRGIPITNFERVVKYARLEFLRQKYKSAKTVQFNEGYALHNTEY